MISWRPARAEERVFAWVWFAAAVAAPVAVWGWFQLGLVGPGCAWHRLTGFPCPTCGSTRAVVTLLAGHPLSALAWNPLVVLALGWFEALGIMAPVWLAFRGTVPVLKGPVPRWVKLGFVGAVALNWFYLVLRGV